MIRYDFMHREKSGVYPSVRTDQIKLFRCAPMNKILIKINSNTNAKSAKKNIRFEHELIDEINDVKYENQSFSSWVKQACR